MSTGTLPRLWHHRSLQQPSAFCDVFALSCSCGGPEQAHPGLVQPVQVALPVQGPLQAAVRLREVWLPEQAWEQVWLTSAVSRRQQQPEQHLYSTVTA